MDPITDEYKEALNSLLENTVQTSEFLEETYPDDEELLTHTDFDKLAGGIPKNALTIIAGATGNGKSLSSLMVSYALACNYTVLYISCENRRKTDNSRLKDLTKLFGVQDTFFYVNIKTVKDKMNAIQGALLSTGFDIIVLDGVQFIMKSGETGGQMLAIGETLVKGILEAINTNDNKPTVLLSWQLRRESAKKKLDDLSTDDIAMSIGIGQACEQAYVVAKGRDKEGKPNGTIWIGSIKNRDVFEGQKNSITLVKNNEMVLLPLD